MTGKFERNQVLASLRQYYGEADPAGKRTLPFDGRPLTGTEIIRAAEHGGVLGDAIIAHHENLMSQGVAPIVQ